ncbi:hypothetical protein KIN20_015886 [Parelaphostrongylus tenuis]|uniref:Uncharacterized protein n=1 Tax=Parelaphostrongylus tenuis TaxID=148309 RepID=A0AAD5MFM0_PARTN|nr:hypothetical protein KIN20_015886 [Parelaphostrongylus tenuis]
MVQKWHSLTQSQVGCERLADVLEDTSSADTDRQIDRQNFNCSQEFQFEIFTHEYRERKEIANCEDNDESHSSCAVLHQATRMKNE